MSNLLGRGGSLVGLLGALALGGCADETRGGGGNRPGEEGGAGGAAGTDGGGMGGTGGAEGRGCKSSLDCGGEGVCGPEKVCVDCVGAADCPDNHSCVDYQCRPRCDSDRDCVSAGLLCDKANGYCVECLGPGECQAEQHCVSGSCRADLCVGGSSACRDGAVVECSEAGDAYGSPSACGSRQTCVEAGGEASCADWRCTAGAVECKDNKVVTCSADGLVVESVVSCGAEQVCASGACQDRACVPSARYCKTDGVYQCAADGLSSTLVASCGGGQYCDRSGEATCKTGVCAPNQPACDGNNAATCNDNGSGYVSAGTPCGSNVCASGVCKPPVCAAAALKCQDEDVYQCASDRLSWTLRQDCAAGTYCDAASPACKAWLCTPSQPACDGNTARTCNGNGSGYLAGGAECVAPGKTCSAGSCVAAGTEGPSCAGLGAICGPGRDRSCCESSVIPGGTYNRSNDASYPATVSDFRLDTYEITVGRFRRFVSAYTRGMIAAGAGKNPNNAADPGWDKAWDASLPADSAALESAVRCSTTYETWTSTAGANENKPMNCLPWYEAEAFCIWDGGRLPTEAEWNYAAAGGREQREYPWGSTEPGADAKLAIYNCYYSGSSDCVAADIAPVGSVSAGNGRWGQADLAGNMWEWVQDWDGPYATACDNCAHVDKNSARYRMQRGGSFRGDASIVLSSLRAASTPTYHLVDGGARCARSAP